MKIRDKVFKFTKRNSLRWWSNFRFYIKIQNTKLNLSGLDTFMKITKLSNIAFFSPRSNVCSAQLKGKFSNILPIQCGTFLFCGLLLLSCLNIVQWQLEAKIQKNTTRGKLKCHCDCPILWKGIKLFIQFIVIYRHMCYTFSMNQRDLWTFLYASIT